MFVPYKRPVSTKSETRDGDTRCWNCLGKGRLRNGQECPICDADGVLPAPRRADPEAELTHAALSAQKDTMLSRSAPTHFDLMLCSKHACSRCRARLRRGDIVALVVDVAPEGTALELFQALCLPCTFVGGRTLEVARAGAAAAVLRVALANLAQGGDGRTRACSAYLKVGSA